LQPPA